MKRVLISVAGGTVVVVGVLIGARPLRHRFSDLRSDLAKVSADTGDVMASATYQRFAVRREAVAKMKAALLSLAAAESAFVADSGQPATNLLFGTYGFQSDKSNLGPSVEIRRDRWIAQVRNIHTDMSCSLTAMLDTVTGRYHRGEPVCAGWTAESVAAVAATQAASRPPEPPLPDPPPAPPPAPRKHREWGPVNNTPPPIPWIVKDVCPGEYCSLGRWAACSTAVAYREKRLDAVPVLTLHPGEEFTALKGDVHVDVPGVVVFRDTVSNPGIEGGPPVDSIRFTPADTLYVLDEIGEGYVNWWFRGRAALGYQFWSDRPSRPLAPSSSDTVVLVRRTNSVWWVRVRDVGGQEGWIPYDYRKFARDDRMDEISRCLPTKKE